MNEIKQFFEPGGVKPLPDYKCREYTEIFEAAEISYREALQQHEYGDITLRDFLDTFYAALTSKELIDRGKLKEDINHLNYLFSEVYYEGMKRESPHIFSGMSMLRRIAGDLSDLYKLDKANPIAPERTDNVVQLNAFRKPDRALTKE